MSSDPFSLSDWLDLSSKCWGNRKTQSGDLETKRVSGKLEMFCRSEASGGEVETYETSQHPSRISEMYFLWL